MMEERELQVKSYIADIEKIIRRDRDISFVDQEDKIRMLLRFFEIYYSSRDTQAHFTENQRQDVESYIYLPFSGAVSDILDRSIWNSAIALERSNAIASAAQRAIDQKYITIAEAAYAANDQTVNAKQKELIEESKKLIDLQRSAIEASESNAKKMLADIKQQEAEITRRLKEVESTATKAKKTLAKQVSLGEGKQFFEDSNRYGNVAQSWLIAMVITASVAVIFIAILVVMTIINPKYVLENPALATLKIGGIALCVYLLQIFSKNYNANKHLQTINKQRATILAFINEFVASVDGDPYKDYLLTYAAKTVFDHGETGFISRNYGAGSDQESSIGELLSIIKKS